MKKLVFGILIGGVSAVTASAAHPTASAAEALQGKLPGVMVGAEASLGQAPAVGEGDIFQQGFSVYSFTITAKAVGEGKKTLKAKDISKTMLEYTPGVISNDLPSTTLVTHKIKGAVALYNSPLDNEGNPRRLNGDYIHDRCNLAHQTVYWTMWDTATKMPLVNDAARFFSAGNCDYSGRIVDFLTGGDLAADGSSLDDRNLFLSVFGEKGDQCLCKIGRLTTWINPTDMLKWSVSLSDGKCIGKLKYDKKTKRAVISSASGVVTVESACTVPCDQERTAAEIAAEFAALGYFDFPGATWDAFGQDPNFRSDSITLSGSFKSSATISIKYDANATKKLTAAYDFAEDSGSTNNIAAFFAAIKPPKYVMETPLFQNEKCPIHKYMKAWAEDKETPAEDVESFYRQPNLLHIPFKKPESAPVVEN